MSTLQTIANNIYAWLAIVDISAILVLSISLVIRSMADGAKIRQVCNKAARLATVLIVLTTIIIVPQIEW